MAIYAPTQTVQKDKKKSNFSTNLPFSDLIDVMQGKNPYSKGKYQKWLDLFSGKSAGGATGLGEGATMESMYGLPGEGSSSLAGTTGEGGSFWSSLFGGGGGAAAGGATGLGPGATMTSMYGLPASGSASLAGTTGAGGGAAGGAALGGLAGLAGLGLFAALAYSYAEKEHSKKSKARRSDPLHKPRTDFYNKYPGAFTNKGIPVSKGDPGKVPPFGEMQYNPKTRRFEMNMPGQEGHGLSHEEWNKLFEKKSRKGEGE